MIHHLVLCKLKPDVDDAKIEWMMRETRMRLLKIPEVRAVRCGKRIDKEQEWPFFLALEFESAEKLALYMADPIHVKYRDEVVFPNITDHLMFDHEMEPGPDLRFV
jgi:hypothetical protein